MKKKVVAGLLSVFSIAMICSVAIPVFVIKNNNDIIESPKKSSYVAEDTKTGLCYTLVEFINKENNYYKVGIDTNALQYGNGLINSSMKSITVPDDYQSPDDDNVNYPIKEIGDNAFSKTGITNITLGSNITKIGLDAFNDCTALTNVTLTNSIEEIDIGAFRGCTNLTTMSTGSNTSGITLPSNDKFTELKAMTFLECSKITTINSFGSVKKIGNSAFDSNKALKTITSWEGVEKIGTLAFTNCTSLNNTIEFSNSLNAIEAYAFYGDSKIDNFIFKNSLYVGNSAFRATNAYGIFEENFDCTSKNTQKNWNDGLTIFNNAKLIENDDAIYIYYKVGDKYLAKLCSTKKNTYTVEEVEDILKPQSYNGNTYDVVSIGNDVFKNKIKVNDSENGKTTLDLSSTNLESIGQSAFEGATCLTEIKLPATLTLISSYAFKDCFGSTNNENLYKIYLSSSSSLVIQDNAFTGTNAYALFTKEMCSSTSGVAWQKGLLSYYLAKDINVSNKDIYSDNITTISLIEITSLDDSKDSRVIKINTLDNKKINSDDFDTLIKTLNDNIELEFDKNLFAGKLDDTFTTLKLAAPLKKVGDGCFKNNPNLTEVEVSSYIESIGAEAFGGCENIISMTLPFIGKEENKTDDFSKNADDTFGYIFNNIGSSTDESSKNSKYYVARSKYAGNDNNIMNYQIPKSLQTIVITDEQIVNHGAFAELCVDNIVLKQEIERIGSRAFIKFKKKYGHQTSVPENYLSCYKCLYIKAANLKYIGDYCFSTNGQGDNSSKLCFSVTDAVFNNISKGNYNGNNAAIYYNFNNSKKDGKNCFTIDSNGKITCYDSNGNIVYQDQ